MSRAFVLHLSIALVTAMPIAEAQDGERDPARLSSLRNQYQAAVERATKPVTASYLAELQKLKTEFARKGDLESAIAVEQEMKRLATPGLADGTPLPPGNPEALLGRRFQFIRNGAVTLLTLAPDGKVQGNDHPNETLWDVSRSGLLQFKNPEGVVTSVFNKKKYREGLFRFEGTAMKDAKTKLDIVHVLQEFSE